MPAACTPVSDPFYAMTFNSVGTQTDGGTGSTTRYPDVTVVDGKAVDCHRGADRRRELRGQRLGGSGDDAALEHPRRRHDARYTSTRPEPRRRSPVNGVWTVNDMDSGERTRYVAASARRLRDHPGQRGHRRHTNTWPDVRSSRHGSGNGDRRAATRSGSRTGAAEAIVVRLLELRVQHRRRRRHPVPPSCDDYGDAPDQLQDVRSPATARATPSHLGLRLGADVEFDGDGQPTAGADGDDTQPHRRRGRRRRAHRRVGGPADDGAASSATNNTTAAATLAGWIDLNGNGTFEAARAGRRARFRRAPARRPTRSRSRPATFVGTTYARFRLFPGTVGDPAADRRRDRRRGRGLPGRRRPPRASPVPPTHRSSTPRSNGAGGVLPRRYPRQQLAARRLGHRGGVPRRRVDRRLRRRPGGRRVDAEPVRQRRLDLALRQRRQGPGQRRQLLPVPVRDRARRAARRVRRCRWTSTPTTRCPRCGSTASPRARSRPGCRRRPATYFHAGFVAGAQASHDAAQRLPARRERDHRARRQRSRLRRVHGPDARRACCATTSATRRNSYGTPLANDGAATVFRLRSIATSSTPLMLGSSIDPEVNGLARCAPPVTTRRHRRRERGRRRSREPGVAGPASR